MLTVVRRWSAWTRAEIEGHVPGDAEVSVVTLTAERGTDATIREIMYRSFRLVFPTEGGDGVVAVGGASGRESRQRQLAFS